MRDYVFEYLNKLTDEDKRRYYAEWAQVEELVAAVEIGNSIKHFVLRDRRSHEPRKAKTQAVRMKKSQFADVYMNDAREVKIVEAQRAEVHVTLSDGTVLDLYSFSSKILEFWKCYLVTMGVRVRRQPFARLSGRDA